MTAGHVSDSTCEARMKTLAEAQARLTESVTELVQARIESLKTQSQLSEMLALQNARIKALEVTSERNRSTLLQVAVRVVSTALIGALTATGAILWSSNNGDHKPDTATVRGNDVVNQGHVGP